MTIIDAKKHGARQCWACYQWTRPAELRENRCRECRKEQPEDWVATLRQEPREAAQPPSGTNAHTPLERSLERDATI